MRGFQKQRIILSLTVAMFAALAGCDSTHDDAFNYKYGYVVPVDLESNDLHKLSGNMR